MVITERARHRLSHHHVQFLSLMLTVLELLYILVLTLIRAALSRAGTKRELSNTR